MNLPDDLAALVAQDEWDNTLAALHRAEENLAAMRQGLGAAEAALTEAQLAPAALAEAMAEGRTVTPKDRAAADTAIAVAENEVRFRRDALAAAMRIRDAADAAFQTAPRRMYGAVFAELCERRIQAAARRDAALAALKEAEDAYQAVRRLQGDVVAMGAQWPGHMPYGISSNEALSAAAEAALWRGPAA